MIICEKCGRRNSDSDEFCGKCGEFLEFVGHRVADPSPPPPPPPPPPQAPQGDAGLVGRVKDALGIERKEEEAPPLADPTANGTAAPDRKPPDSKPPDIGSRRPDEEPPVRWTPPREERHPRDDPRTAEQGRFCSVCGWGNDASRNFCRHCGESLQPVQRERIAWWRRLLPRRRPPAAGDRPQVRASDLSLGSLLSRFIATMLVVLLAAGLLAFVIAPSFRTQVSSRVDQGITAARGLLFNRGYVEIHPVATVASSSFVGHPAQNVDDLVSNDYWAADTARDQKPTLHFTFDGRTNLDVLEIRTGAGETPDFTKLARPRTVEITYSDGPGQRLTLNDDPKPTAYNVYARGVTSMTMKITSVYPVGGTTLVALDEIEFLRLK